MSDLRELYQEMILDHGKNPRNFRRLDHATSSADGHNPLCGDRLTVYLRTEEGRVAEASFQGSGCAISTASASMMTDALTGATAEQALEFFKRFCDVATGRADSEAEASRLGKLAVFAGVARFPVRVKCATLAWHTMRAALLGETTTVGTE